MGTLIRIRHPPPFFGPPFSSKQSHRPRSGGSGPASLPEFATGRGNDPSIPESLLGRARGCFGGPVGVRDRPETPRLAAVSRSFQGFTRTGGHTDSNSALVAKSFITPRMQDGVRGTSRRCGGSFAEQVAGNVDKGKAPPLLREHLEIRLDENLDGLFARINLDTNGRVAEIDLVASPVFSSNYGVGHWVWLSEISGVGLAKRLSGGQSRDVFPSINQI